MASKNTASGTPSEERSAINENKKPATDTKHTLCLAAEWCSRILPWRGIF
jgi:hypothetical protein